MSNRERKRSERRKRKRRSAQRDETSAPAAADAEEAEPQDAGREAVGGMLGQQRRQHLVEERREFGRAVPGGSRREFEVGVDRGGRGLVAERVVAGRQLVEHHTEGEEVAARIRFLPAHLLRSHVVRGTHDHPRRSQRRGDEIVLRE